MLTLETVLNEWIKSDSTITHRTPLWEFHNTFKGFEQVVEKTMIAGPHRPKPQNRMAHNNPYLFSDPTAPINAMPRMVLEAVKDPEGFSECFKCESPDVECVDTVCYDEKRLLLKVIWRKSRKGTRGGVPAGNVTIYDHVPRDVFDYLVEYNKRMGRVGTEIWNMVRGKTTDSLYPYSNMAGDE